MEDIKAIFKAENTDNDITKKLKATKRQTAVLKTQPRKLKSELCLPLK